MIRLATAVLLYCLGSVAAAAADVKIGDVPIHLPKFPGHCELDPVQASDGRLVATLHRSVAKTGNRLLMLSAGCTELKEWRDDKRPVLDHMAQYQTVLALENGILPDAPEVLVKGYCDEAHAIAEKSMPGTRPDAHERVEEAAKIVKVGEMRFLGVAAAEPLVCYAATLHKFSVENAGEFTQATVIAATVVKDKVLICYLSAPYAGVETIPQLLSRQRANISHLRRANP